MAERGTEYRKRPQAKKIDIFMKLILQLSKYLAFILFAVFSDISAEEIQTNYFYKNNSSWDISFYGGKYTETDLLPILFNQNTRYKDSNIYVLAFSKE